MRQFLENFFKIKNFSKHGEEVVAWAVFPSTWSDDKTRKLVKQYHGLDV